MEKINIKDAESYIQIYKAGFIDGYVSASPPDKNISWEKIWKKCVHAFEKRFKVMKGGQEYGKTGNNKQN
jgi:hypothetical protein